MNKRAPRLLGLALAGALIAPAAAVEIQLVNLDIGTGIGLDDPSPRTPIGGNPGTTLGQQRQIAYQFAADLWSAVFAGDAPVRVTASFQPLSCTPTSGTLAQAGALSVFRDFPDAIPGTWYHVALVKGILDADVNFPNNDILTQFNGAIGVNPNCLTGSDWYYGLDGNTPAGQINFLNVVMHEIAHGLGFSGFENINTGAFFSGFPSIYATYAFDNATGNTLRNLTNAQRVAAVRNDGGLVWSGGNVTTQAPLVLAPGVVNFAATAPAGIAGSYPSAAAAFGPAATPDNFSGQVVLANDGSAAPSEGCSAFANAAEVAGNIALVDRGTCPFVDKVLNAQAAGATGVLIANNVAGVIAPGGASDAVTIPTLGISLATGNLFKANLAELAVALTVDMDQLQGADTAGRVQLYAPTTAAGGSTYSHFDTRLTPNALMEPFNTASLRADIDLDLTPALFQDEGWPLDEGTARLGSCDTGVPIQIAGGLIPGAGVLATSNVCRLGTGSRGEYVSCMDAYAERMLGLGLITPRQKGSIMSCAARLR